MGGIRIVRRHGGEEKRGEEKPAGQKIKLLCLCVLLRNKLVVEAAAAAGTMLMMMQ